ncbi:MAG TPA: arsenate reductase ArsC [Chthoniobacterales bacterium]|jgi:arsenate reductase
MCARTRLLHEVSLNNSMKEKVLFICIHNSARSQMAEAWLNVICGDYFEAQSAGLEPGKLNPFAVQVMAEAGIDISKKKTQSTADVLKSGEPFACVITVCDETSAERCPIFPGPAQRLHWTFPDPSAVTGTEKEKLRQVRMIRDEIRSKVEKWCEQVCPRSFAPG